MKAVKDETGIVAIVARNVRAARKAAGLSQEALAHTAGVDRTYVSQVERRQRNLTITVLARLATALGSTPDRLLIEAKSGAGKSSPRAGRTSSH
jgi:transcriptional regulator with XRE-family HTH domain